MPSLPTSLRERGESASRSTDPERALDGRLMVSAAGLIEDRDRSLDEIARLCGTASRERR